MSDLPNPKSRNEKFLNAIAKRDLTDLPVPQSRNEIFLDYIARNGGTGGEGLTPSQLEKLNKVDELSTQMVDLKNNLQDCVGYRKFNGEWITAEHTLEDKTRNLVIEGNTVNGVSVGDLQTDGKYKITLVSVTENIATDVELGGLAWATGIPSNSLTDRYRSKEFINVVPNSKIVTNIGTKNFGIFQYDKNKKFLKCNQTVNNAIMLENTRFIKVVTENKNLIINYNILNVNNIKQNRVEKEVLLTEPLRSFGDIKDTIKQVGDTFKLVRKLKEQDGVITELTTYTEEDLNIDLSLNTYDVLTYVYTDTEVQANLSFNTLIDLSNTINSLEAINTDNLKLIKEQELKIADQSEMIVNNDFRLCMLELGM